MLSPWFKTLVTAWGFMGAPPVGRWDASGDDELRVIANRLRVLRLGRGLTYYQRIEAGQANVTLRTLGRVARALGISFAELVRLPMSARRRVTKGARRR